MSMYYVEIGFTVQTDVPEDDLDSHFGLVLDYLLDDDRVVDPDYVATLAVGDVTFSLSIEAGDESAAIGLVAVCLRAAIHAAEGSTPGWEEKWRRAVTTVRGAELAH